MQAVQRVLDLVELITKAEDDDLKDELEAFEDVDFLVDQINKFEKRIAKLLRNERKHFVDGLEGYIFKEDDPLTLQRFYETVFPELLASDTFEEEMAEAAYEFFNATIPQVVSRIMEELDKDLSFNTLSGRTVAWIEDWSIDLAELMRLTSHRAIERVLVDTINEGKGIPDAVKALKDLPEFSRNRARATAITEILTANAASQQEAYLQSPAVEMKRWRHSGPRKIKPRENHVDLSGTEIPVDEAFDVGGYSAMYPRDPQLPAKERVYCRCVLQPVVNSKILGLSAEEKEELRRQAMAEFDYAKYKKPPRPKASRT